MPNTIAINGQVIGRGHQPYIIAEAGVNHNGQLDIAKELVRAAKAAKADAVKFQTFQAETLATAYADAANYQVKSTGQASQRDILRKLELKHSDYQEIIEFCKSLNITFFSTPFSRSDADFLHSLNVPLYKISSGDLISLPLLEYIAKFSKPMIISTGMGTIAEIKEAVDLLSKYNQQMALLQCTSSYPCELQYINLNVLSNLEQFGYPVGFSDHSLGIGCAIIAVFKGACIIEKHLTLDKDMEGPDHLTSLEPDEFCRMTLGAKDAYRTMLNGKDNLASVLAKYEPGMIDKIELVLGSEEKKPAPPEYEIMLKGRKSIVANKALKKGIKIPNDIGSVLGTLFEFKRPGIGLQPKHLYKIMGKTLLRDVQGDGQIELADFSEDI